MIHAYTAYGLTFHLSFPCPILSLAAPDAAPDVMMVEGPVPRQLAAPLAQDPSWQAEPGRFLLKAGQYAGRFLVESGRRITLQRSPRAEDQALGFHFLDSVLAAALRQNGLLVLHANSVVIPGGAVAVSGASGAGKSTALAALLRRGCAMLADDVTVLRLGADGRVEVLPGAAQYCLCEDAASSLGQNVAGLPRHRRRNKKFVVPAHSAIAKSPVPLQSLYLLRSHSGGDLRVRRLHGAEKFDAVQEAIYGPLLPEEYPRQFPLFAALTSQVKVFRMERPEKRWTADAVAEVLLHG
jgi:hypothetical protein